ncbi:MAG: amino acid ABC transporter permease [Desulfovibrio sp.]|nr:amino acid ABC transporter permease [Desulfovibrio sp.]
MAEWSPLRAFAPTRQTGLLAWADLLFLCILMAGLAAAWLGSRSLPGYDWQWPLLGDFLVSRGPDGSARGGLLMQGLFTTLRVGFWTFLFSLAAGMLLALASSARSACLSWPALAMTNLLRNTPPLVILFVVYFFAGNLLPVAPLERFFQELPAPMPAMFNAIVAPKGELDRMLAAIIALGFYQSAYVAEILRGGIESIPKGQWDAAAALGFGKFDAIRLVVLPQAARSILPPLTGQCISTFKDSALASLISLPDLTFQSLEIMAISRMTFEVWTVTALIYLCIGLVLTCAGYLLEVHYSHHLNRN